MARVYGSSPLEQPALQRARRPLAPGCKGRQDLPGQELEVARLSQEGRLVGGDGIQELGELPAALVRHHLAEIIPEAEDSPIPKQPLFGQLLERTYIDKVEGYSGEKVNHLGERVDGDYAQVDVKIVTNKNTEIPVIYRLRVKDQKWWVYDMVIEGVSLVNNYRTQVQ